MEQGIYDAAAVADQAEAGVEALDPRMDLVEQRLDNLIPQGTPTEGNAELIDIRVGANGVTYPTAGDAVRGQYGDLKSALTDQTETKQPQTRVSTASNKISVYNTQYNRIAVSAHSKYNTDVYEVLAGDVLEIYAYGNNQSSAPFACVGDANQIVTGASYCTLLQIISPDTETLGYHTVTATIEDDGFLYVNYLTAYGTATVKKNTTTLIPKTDKTLSLESIPADAKATGDIANYRGVYIDNGSYYHFVRDGGSDIIRLFIRRGPNNLFQWNQILLGNVTDQGVEAITSYTGFGTDIIGPISIWNGTLWPGVYGAWSGGNHGKTIDGHEYATAEQISFKCLVNGEEVSADGLYFGDVQFIVTNKLYFPQSITGADLTGATAAIIEHRMYNLTGTKMSIRVWHEFLEDVRIALYCGMQMADGVFDTVFCTENGYSKTLSSIDSTITLSEKEREIILQKSDNGLTLVMRMDDIGLGKYNLNDGSGGYVDIPNHGSGGIKKTYYKLIYKSPTQPIVEGGKNLVWEGSYDLHFE
jgi:hypothetical protein